MLVYKKVLEVEIWYVPSYYEKNQLTFLALTQVVFFDEIHIQHISGPPTTSRLNENSFSLPRDKDGKLDVENCTYDMNNQQQQKATFKYEKEERLCLGRAKVESLEVKITGKCCLMFYCKWKQIINVYGYKKEILKSSR